MRGQYCRGRPLCLPWTRVRAATGGCPYKLVETGRVFTAMCTYTGEITGPTGGITALIGKIIALTNRIMASTGEVTASVNDITDSIGDIINSTGEITALIH